jgi:hypothetical protein
MINGTGDTTSQRFYVGIRCRTRVLREKILTVFRIPTPPQCLFQISPRSICLKLLLVFPLAAPLTCFRSMFSLSYKWKLCVDLRPV